MESVHRTAAALFIRRRMHLKPASIPISRWLCMAVLAGWSGQRFIPVMRHEPATVNVWSPELFHDASTGQFIILWASAIPRPIP